LVGQFIGLTANNVAYGIPEGVRSLTESLEASRAASKGLSQSIENIQQDGLDVAQRQAKQRQINKRETEVKKQLAIHKALAEHKKRRLITEEEFKLKTDFIKKFGTKEWESVLKIKNELEALEKQNIAEFQHDLKAVRRVQFWCFFVAGLIAWYFTWGIK